MSKSEVTVLHLWLVLFIFVAWFVGMIMGGWATVIDARRNGYNVPHLWQPFKKDEGKCK